MLFTFHSAGFDASRVFQIIPQTGTYRSTSVWRAQRDNTLMCIPNEDSWYLSSTALATHEL